MLQIDDEFFGTQRFIGNVRGTELLAPAALDAGVKVERLLPRVVRDVRYAERRGGFVFEIEFRHLPARAEPAEQDLLEVPGQRVGLAQRARPEQPDQPGALELQDRLLRVLQTSLHFKRLLRAPTR